MEKTKTVTLIPYKYFGINSGFTEKNVYVIKGDEHPDPAKRLMWGLDANGYDFPGDYNRNFSRNGKPIVIEYKTKGLSALEEQKDELKAIRNYLNRHNIKYNGNDKKLHA
ncbi:MAG: hypothetical protein QXL94_00955 [Candidatus Parvarchaeum sp.]